MIFFYKDYNKKMIEPFEYEKTRCEARIRENVTDGGLDTSLLDRPLKKLNHFDSVPEFEHYRERNAPFTKAHQERVGRVSSTEEHKADQQSEAIGQLGSMNSGYDVSPSVDVMNRPNASSLIHSYLDRDVSFVPQMVNTMEPIENMAVDEPALQPGISFIDSRKNMATRF